MAEIEKKEEIDPKTQVACGIDGEGYLIVKAHLGLGFWNLLGICEQAKMKVTAYFVGQAKAQEEKLVRPNGNSSWLHKWKR